MNDIFSRLEAIIENVPSRDCRNHSEEQKEKYYNTLEAAEDAFLDVVEEIVPKNIWQEKGVLDEICRLAIKEDGAYVDGEDKEYSNYQDRLPFRLYENLNFWTIPIPGLLIDEIRKHLPEIKL